jgi:hypothetical protein
MSGFVITKELVCKINGLLDHGLVKGVGSPEPGKMCVEALVNYAMGLPHGDDPSCVAPALRRLKIRLNDSNWSSDKARAKGLRRLAIAQLGSAGVLDEKEFARRCADLAIRSCVPSALRAAAKIQKDEKHRAALLDAADRCERDGGVENARSAQKIAAAAADADAAAAAAHAAYAAAAADADAYAYAAAAAAPAAAADAAADADAAAAAAAYADAAAAADADAYAYAAAAAAHAAYAAAYAAADAAAYAYAYADAAAADAAAAAAHAAYAHAAYAAADADAYAYAAYAESKARDEQLSAFAEGVVQILIAMRAPGCEWLDLTEAA